MAAEMDASKRALQNGSKAEQVFLGTTFQDART